MRSYKRYTRRKRVLKQIAVVALVFILGFVLLRAVSYMAIQGEIPMINSFNLFRKGSLNTDSTETSVLIMEQRGFRSVKMIWSLRSWNMQSLSFCP